MISKEFNLTNLKKEYKNQMNMILQIACEHKSSITIVNESNHFNAKSIMMLGRLEMGERFQLVIEGDDEECAMKSFEEFFADY